MQQKPNIASLEAALIRGLTKNARSGRGASVSSYDDEEKEEEVVAPPKRAPPPKPSPSSEDIVTTKRLSSSSSSPNRVSGNDDQQPRGPLPPPLPSKPRTASFRGGLAPPVSALHRLVAAALPFVPAIVAASNQPPPADAKEEEKKGMLLAGLKKLGKLDSHFSSNKVMNDQIFIWSEETQSPSIFRANLGGLVNVSCVVAGRAHFLLLVDGGRVFSWGSGKFGALGHGDTLNSAQPRLVEFLARKGAMHSICAGGCQSGAVSEENQAFLWGESGGSKSIVTPAICPLENKVQKMAMGHDFVVLCDAQGRLVAFGNDDEGQTCVAKLTFPDFVTNVSAFGKTACALTSEGGVFWWGKGSGSTTRISRLQLPKKAKQAEAGDGCVLVLSMEGAVFGVGNNAHGQLGTLLPEQVTAISPLRLLEENDAEEDDIDTSIGRFAFLKRNSTKQQLKPVVVTGPVHIKSIACGGTHAAALTSQGTVVRWGSVWGKQSSKFVSESALASTPMSRVFCGEHSLGCILALRSLDDLKFASFSPPLIEAASLDRLCEWLIETHIAGEEFGVVFFHMLTTFSSVSEFGCILRDKLAAATRAGNVVLKQKIIKTAIKWMTVRPFDLKIEAVREVIEEMGRLSGGDDYGQILISELSRCLNEPRALTWRVQPNVNFVAGSVSVFSFSAITVAEQLTLITQSLFGRIVVSDLFSRPLPNNVSELLERSLRLQSYIVSSILRQSAKDTRSKAAAFWIEVQRQLCMVGNFEDAASIASVFRGNAAIARLREREELDLKSSSLRQLAEFDGLFENHRKGYDTAIASHASESTCFPILGMLLLELDALISSTPDMTEDKLINFQKRRSAFSLLKSTPWMRREGKSSIQPLSDLAEYLASAKGDSELDQLSQAETIIASSKEKQAEDSMLILSPAEKRAESLLGLLKSASPQSISDIKLNAIIGSFVSDPPSSAEEIKLFGAVFSLYYDLDGQILSEFLLAVAGTDPEASTLQKIASIVSTFSKQQKCALSIDLVESLQNVLQNDALKKELDVLDSELTMTANSAAEKRSTRDEKIAIMEEKLATMRAQLEQAEREAEEYRRESGRELRDLDLRFKLLERGTLEKKKLTEAQEKAKELLEKLNLKPVKIQEDNAPVVDSVVVASAPAPHSTVTAAAKKKLDVIEVVRALYQHVPEEEGELAFQVGDLIHVTRKHKSGWSKGFLENDPDQTLGVFPHVYVEKKE